MVRKTREEAEQTRQLILDTAEQVFLSKGVATTSLADIASSAGLTRGAIYWHFDNKLDLFRALCDRLDPYFDQLLIELQDQSCCPATRLWRHSHDVFRLIRNNDNLKRLCGIHHLACEQVGELAPILLEHIDWKEDKLAYLENVFEEARLQGKLKDGVLPKPAAISLQCLHNGLINSWMLQVDNPYIPDHLDALLSPYFEGVFRQAYWKNAVPQAVE